MKESKKSIRTLRCALIAASSAALLYTALLAWVPQARTAIIQMAEIFLVKHPLNRKLWDIRLLHWASSAAFLFAAGIAALLARYFSDENYVARARARERERETVLSLQRNCTRAESTAVYILYAFAVVNIIVVLLTLVNKSIWVDEAFTLSKIRHPYVWIIKLLAKYDVHCPLYFIITKFIVDTVHLVFHKANAIIIAKIGSTIPIALMILIAATKVKKNWGRLCGAYFAMCATGVPFVMKYAVEMRMYSWVMLFITMTFLCAYDCVTLPSIKNWILLALCAAASCYGHYFGCVSTAVMYAWLLVWFILYDKAHIKHCIISGAAALLLFSPWITACIHGFTAIAGKNFWIKPIGGKELLNFAKGPFDFGGKMGSLMLCCIIALFVFAIVYQIKHIDKKAAFFSAAALSVYFLTVLVGCVVSWIVRPIFVIRYAVQGVPLIYLSLCVLLSQSRHIKAVPVLMVLFASLSLFSNISTFAINEFTQKENSEKVMAALEGIGKDDIIVTTHGHLAGVFDYLTDDVKVFCGQAGQYDNSVKRPLIDSIKQKEPINMTAAAFPNITYVKDFNYVPVPRGKVYFILNSRGKDKEEKDFKAYMASAGLSPKHIGNYRYNVYNAAVYVLE